MTTATLTAGSTLPTAPLLGERQAVPVFAFVSQTNAVLLEGQRTAPTGPAPGVAAADRLPSHVDACGKWRDAGGVRFLSGAAWLFGASSVFTGAMSATGLDGSPRHVGVGLTFVAVGVALSLLGSAGRKLYVKRWDAKLAKAAEADLRAVELAVAETKGIARGLILARVKSAYKSLEADYYGHDSFGQLRSHVSERLLPWLSPSLMTEPFAQRVAALADQVEALSPEERAQVDQLLWIDGTLKYSVLGHCGFDVEEVLRRLEQLTPEARSLLDHDLKDKIIEKLSAHRENVYRVQRLREAYDGERKPYAAQGGEESSSALKISSLRNATKLTRSGELVCPDAGFAIDAVKQQRETSKSEAARVFIQDVEAAKQVAAHFELNGLRAALFVEPNATVVTVYDADKPPSDSVVRGC